MVTNSNEKPIDVAGEMQRRIVDLMTSAICQAVHAYRLSHPCDKTETPEFLFNNFVYPINAIVNSHPSIFNGVIRMLQSQFKFETHEIPPNEIPPNYLKQIEVVENEVPADQNILRDATEELIRVMDFAQASPRTPTKETFSIDARHCHTSEGFEIVETVSIQVKISN